MKELIDERVFISSTCYDLGDERRQIDTTLSELGYDVVRSDSEYFNSEFLQRVCAEGGEILPAYSLQLRIGIGQLWLSAAFHVGGFSADRYGITAITEVAGVLLHYKRA